MDNEEPLPMQYCFGICSLFFLLSLSLTGVIDITKGTQRVNDISETVNYYNPFNPNVREPVKADNDVPASMRGNHNSIYDKLPPTRKDAPYWMYGDMREDATYNSHIRRTFR